MSDKQRAKHIEDAKAAYWLTPITRREAQAVFDEYSSAINTQADMVHKLDFIISYLFEKLNISPEELQAWTAAKIESLKQAATHNQNGHASAPEAPVVEPPPVILSN